VRLEDNITDHMQHFGITLNLLKYWGIENPV